MVKVFFKLFCIISPLFFAEFLVEETLHIFQRWVIDAIYFWRTTVLPTVSLLSVTIKIGIFLFSNEDTFSNLNQINVPGCFIEIIKSVLSEIGATTHVDYVKLIRTFLTHNSGFSWLISTHYWSELVILTLASQEESPMTLEGCGFISRLIEKSFSVNLVFCSGVINSLLIPIIDAKKTAQSSESVPYYKCIKPSLTVLESTMVALLYTKNPNVFKHFVDVATMNDFEKHAFEICEELTDENTLFSCVNSLYLLYFFDVLHNIKEVVVLSPDDIACLLAKSETFRKNVLLKKPITVYAKLMHNGLKYKHIVKGIFPKILTKDRVVMSCKEQLIYHQLFPCVIQSFKFFGMNYTYYDSKDSVREQVTQKHVERIVSVVFKMLFQLKEAFESNCTFEESSFALRLLLESMSFYKRAEANIIVDLLMFCYEDLGNVIAQDSMQGVMVSLEKQNYLACMIETIRTLICQFNLDWRDILETLVVMEITGHVLCVPKMTKNVSTVILLVP